MDYVMCFFRPENKFPERVFGGFSRDLNDPRKCSLDLFAYLSVPSKGACAPLPEGWSLKEISSEEVWELENFYRRVSGGLFVDVLKRPLDAGEESLSETSARRGFTRKWSLYGLFFENSLACVTVVNQSDFGINLSELLNSITVMIIEGDRLSPEVLLSAVSQLAAVYGIDKVPLLIYPCEYVESKGMTCEKHYRMWVIDMQYSNLFLEFVQKKFRMKYE
jgi:hypothetical protein